MFEICNAYLLLWRRSSTYAKHSSTSACGISGYAFEHNFSASIYVARHIWNMFREAPKRFNSSSSKEVFYSIFYMFLGLIVSSIHLILREDSHRLGTSRWKQEITAGRRSGKKSQRLRCALKDENNFAPHRLRRSRSVTHLVWERTESFATIGKEVLEMLQKRLEGGQK